jgi:hypothetical protein
MPFRARSCRLALAAPQVPSVYEGTSGSRCRDEACRLLRFLRRLRRGGRGFDDEIACEMAESIEVWTL